MNSLTSQFANYHGSSQFEHITGETSTVIIGSGLAGLAAAVKLKEALPSHDVLVVEKEVPQSNTLVAGQRFRAGIAGQRVDGPEEIAFLLASRNMGHITTEMEYFSEIATQELEYWQSLPGFMEVADRQQWFGPQWGTPNKAGEGRGRSVLAWFRDQAVGKGVQFYQAQAQELVSDGMHVEGLAVTEKDEAKIVIAGNYVVAAGGMGGYIFESTNRAIRQSGHELMLKAGIPLSGATLHMQHPFSRSDSQGGVLRGCYETDRLAGARVYLDGLSNNPVFDEDTTELLAAHEAHYHFPEISRKFNEYGSVALLVFPDGDKKLTRVSHHHTQFGVPTVNGVDVASIDNLLAVGDAAGLNHWTNHKERFPGFALTKCLVDAVVVVDQVQQYIDESPARLTITPYGLRLPEVSNRTTEKNIRRLNTGFMNAWIDTDSKNPDIREKIADEWLDSLEETQLVEGGSQLGISKAIARAHKAVGSGKSAEPYAIKIEE